jgi:hypothetical protein
VFHISLLEPAPKNAEITTNVKIEDETENKYKIKEILKHERINSRVHYLVK